MNFKITNTSLNIILFLTLIFALFVFIFYISARKKLQLNENEAKMKRFIIMNQIRPHFIFNCLSSIEALCEINPKKAQIALSDLSQLLRDSMDDLGSDRKKSFPEIIKMTTSYMRLEQMRFGDKLKVQYDFAETGFSLPPLIIQPLVENAVKHGLANKKDGGMVKISSYKDGKDIVICVEDNGMGMYSNDENKEIDLDGKSHIGLSNVKERLRLLCNGEMEIQSKKEIGTKILLRIPSEDT